MIILGTDLMTADQQFVLDDLICMNQNDVYLFENIVEEPGTGKMDTNVPSSINSQDETLSFSDVLDINMPDIFVC